MIRVKEILYRVFLLLLIGWIIFLIKLNIKIVRFYDFDILASIKNQDFPSFTDWYRLFV